MRTPNAIPVTAHRGDTSTTTYQADYDADVAAVTWYDRSTRLWTTYAIENPDDFYTQTGDAEYAPDREQAFRDLDYVIGRRIAELKDDATIRGLAAGFLADLADDEEELLDAELDALDHGPRCEVRGCDDPATATVLVSATRLPHCFLHEREYVDRYGPEGVRGIGGPTSDVGEPDHEEPYRADLD